MHKLDCYPEAPGHHVRRFGHAGVAESRETLPKQFIPLVGERSTFQTTIAMLADPAFETPIVIFNKDYRFLIADQLGDSWCTSNSERTARTFASYSSILPAR
jgi:hypothetical protein